MAAQKVRECFMRESFPDNNGAAQEQNRLIGDTRAGEIKAEPQFQEAA
jgi:hypothetical protein